MWELVCEECWAPKNWCFWTVVLEKILENPLDCKEIQPVRSEGDQSWVFFGSNNAKAETPVLWPPHAKSWLIGKDSDAGRDWGQEEKGMTEDEMAEWHHWLDGCESEWTPGVGDGQGGLACCDSWGCKELDTTERVNWTDGFSKSHVQMGELYHKECWVPKNWCFWTVVLEKTLENHVDSKEIKPINPKGNQPWIFIERSDAEAEAPILWPPDAKSRLSGKALDAGKG